MRLFWAVVLTGLLYAAGADAGPSGSIASNTAGRAAAMPQQLAQSVEGCETRCTENHGMCETDASSSIDECELDCDDNACSKCASMSDPLAVEDCHTTCDKCKSQCDFSAETRRQTCDADEQKCVAKCTQTN